MERFELDYFPLTDLDDRLDYYTPIIIASEKTLDDEPELTRAFLRALSRGYQIAVDDPERAARALRAHASEIGAEHARRGVEYLSPYTIDEGERWGEMERSVWRDFTGFLAEYDLFSGTFDVDAAFTNEFLPQR